MADNYSLQDIRDWLTSATPTQLFEVTALVLEQQQLEREKQERLREQLWTLSRERTFRIADATYHGDVSQVRGCEHLVRYQTRKEYLASLEPRGGQHSDR